MKCAPGMRQEVREAGSQEKEEDRQMEKVRKVEEI